MARQLTKELALKIVKKLKAKKGSMSRAHQLYDVFDGETLVVSFGVRHGSEKDQGHDHLQRDLGVNTHKAKCLAQCTFSKQQWLEHIRGT